MKRGAIFDMDGVLFDTEKLYQESWHEVADEEGVVLGANFAKDICGSSGEGTMEVLRKYFHVEDPAEIRNRTRAKVTVKLAESLELKPGVPELLTYLKMQGYRTAVASSSSAKRIRECLERGGLAELFDQCVSGAELTHGKPSPDIFLLAAQEIGLPASDCYVFEDSWNGIQAGHASGAFTVMVPDLTMPDDVIRKTADAICVSMFEVLERLQNGTL